MSKSWCMSRKSPYSTISLISTSGKAKNSNPTTNSTERLPIRQVESDDTSPDNVRWVKFRFIQLSGGSAELQLQIARHWEYSQEPSRIGGGTESGTNEVARLFSPFWTAISQTVFSGTWLWELNEIVPVTPLNPSVCSRARSIPLLFWARSNTSSMSRAAS